MNSPPPQRVGYILTAVWEGGLERFTCELIDGMDRDEFAPYLYVLTAHNPWIEQFERRGLPIRVFRGTNTPSIRSLPSLGLVLGQLARALRRDRIDVLHTCDFLPATLGRVASLLAGTPHRIHTLHSLYDWYPSWTHKVNRLLAARTDCITAVSRSVAAQSAVADKLPLDRLNVVLNGSDPQRFRPLPEARAAIRAELGIPDDHLLIGSIGSITSRKAHHLLIEAVTPLVQVNPRLHVALFGAAHGGPQDDIERVRAAISASGRPEQFRVHPPRPDVERLFSAFDVHCMPSIVEGLSLASVEAQLCGSLSVLSDIGPFREVVQDGHTGFLFRSGDVQHLREVLQKALALPDSASFRTAAREDALVRFDKQRMVATYLDLYRSFLSPRPL